MSAPAWVCVLVVLSSTPLSAWKPSQVGVPEHGDFRTHHWIAFEGYGLAGRPAGTEAPDNNFTPVVSHLGIGR